MNCKICGAELHNNAEYCEKCAAQAQSKARNKSFWGELEKNQTTIEEFGYRVKTEIRKSENTVVYIASNDEDETVAIKKISLPYSQQDSLISENDVASRVRAEMDALSRISSDSGNRFVITYYDYKLIENTEKLKYDLYIRMDYLTSLGQLFSESKLSIKDLLTMSADICDALDWCHKNDRIHNNLNMNNIFINNDGRYVLGDFSSFGYRKNEAEYCIAPELFYGEKPCVSTDIYSLGMVMFVLLNNGLPPFSENDSAEDSELSVKRLRNGEIPSLARSVNHRLSNLVYKAISPKENRFNSVDEMKKAIEFLLNSMPEEWLEQNLNDINCTENGSDDTVLADKSATDVIIPKEQPKEEIAPKTLEPEEVALKKKNIKDFWLIGVVAIVLIAAIAAGTAFLYNSGNREIYSLIESESYAVAFKEISELEEKGQNVDDLLKTYIDACMRDSEYKRVVQALPLFSDEAFEDSEYFMNIYSNVLSSGKEKLAKSVYDILYKNETLRPMLNKTEQ